MFYNHIIFWMFNLYHNNKINSNNISNSNNNKMREALGNTWKNTMGVRQPTF